jgi:RNA polymerase sigma-70 factor (ECF subfamily)
MMPSHEAQRLTSNGEPNDNARNSLNKNGLIELRLHALLVQGLTGDEAAYRDFLQVTSTHLRAFLRRRLHRWPDEVEDLLQESLLAIHNQREKHDNSAPLTAWLYAITKHKLIDWLRKYAKHEMQNVVLDEDTHFFSTAAADAYEARCDLTKLLNLLPEQQRAAIMHTKYT